MASSKRASRSTTHSESWLSCSDYCDFDYEWWWRSPVCVRAYGNEHLARAESLPVRATLEHRVSPVLLPASRRCGPARLIGGIDDPCNGLLELTNRASDWTRGPRRTRVSHTKENQDRYFCQACSPSTDSIAALFLSDGRGLVPRGRIRTSTTGGGSVFALHGTLDNGITITEPLGRLQNSSDISTSTRRDLVVPEGKIEPDYPRSFVPAISVFDGCTATESSGLLWIVRAAEYISPTVLEFLPVHTSVQGVAVSVQY